MINKLLSKRPDLMLVLLLCLSASWPFWARPSLPRETDAELHVFRTAEWAYAIQAGDPYPRWASNFYYGYGYPIFNYYAPLTYLAGNVFALANPNLAVFGVKMVIILTFLGAGVGVWGVGKQLTDRQGAVIAAASYLFAPYIYLIDPHLRGALAEFLALGVAPMALWLLMRFQQRPSATNLTLASTATACLILSHNLLGLALFALLLAWIVWQNITEQQHSVRRVLLSVSPFVVGVLLSAFFWLPVALEQEAVQLGNLVGPGNFDFRNHFVLITELFAPVQPLDLGAANPAFRFNLGVAQVLLSVLGIIGAFVSNDQRIMRQAVFWTLASFALIFLMLPASQFIWEAIPQAAFVQFPWRLLGPAALTLALLAAYASQLSRFLPDVTRALSVAGAVGLPIILMLPAFVPPDWEDFGDTNRQAIIAFELSGVALGTTSTGDYLPIGVAALPGPAPSIIEDIQNDRMVNRIDEAQLPDATSVSLIRSGVTSNLLRVETDTAITLTLQTFAFDGWRAEIDGNNVPITISEPHGFIQIDVPEGTHTVGVKLGSTPPRVAGIGLSIIGLVTLITIFVIPINFPSTSTVEEAPWAYWALVSRVVGVVMVLVSVSATVGFFQTQSTGTIAEPAAANTREYLQGGIDLIGYDLPSQPLTAGEMYPVTLYWKAREPIFDNYQVFVHLDTGPIQTWAQSDKLNPGDYPTTRWPLDKYIRDVHMVQIPYGTPPGDYEVRVGLWNFMTGIRQLVLAEDATILGDTVLLGTVTVQTSDNPIRIEQLPIDPRETVTISEQLSLLGLARSPSEDINQQDGVLSIDLYWQVLEEIPEDYAITIRIRLREEDEPIYELVAPPAADQYPMTEWSAGEVVRDVHALRFDGAMPDGAFAIELALLDEANKQVTPWTEVDTFSRGTVKE